jgi:hypothetical protein
VPTALVARTVQVTVTLLARPVTTSGELVPVLDFAPHVAVYDVIGRPPLFASFVKLTLAWVLPGEADTPVGALGTVAGVTDTGGAEAGPVPWALRALTVQFTAMPLARFVTTSGELVPVCDFVPHVAV